MIKRVLVLLLWLASAVVFGAYSGLAPWVDHWTHRMANKLARRRAAADLAANPLSGWVVSDGFGLSAHAEGLRSPSRIVFHPQAGDPTGEDQPFYYVAELPGTIRLVHHDGTHRVLADGLVGHEWHPGLEAGLMGLDVSRDASCLYYSRTIWDERGGVYRSEVRRIDLEDGGRKAGADSLVLQIDEPTVPSYCVQFVKIDPDGMSIYVGVGSGASMADAQDLEKLAGKVLRIMPDGAGHDDNPHFDPGRARAVPSLICAHGLRNPVDLAWTRAGVAYVTDVGPGIDRILQLVPGRNYCYGLGDGDAAMRSNAAYTWGPQGRYAPTGLVVLNDDEEDVEYLYVGMFGAVGAAGADTGKMVVRCPLDSDAAISGAMTPVVEYRGPFFSSVSAVALGPDGRVYFADFYGSGDGPPVGKGRVLSIELEGCAGPRAVAPLSGKELFAAAGCAACHDTAPSEAAKEGPSLSGLMERLLTRLSSNSYIAKIESLSRDDADYFVGHRGNYAAILGAHESERPWIWFLNHVHAPRFDNPDSKMPAYPHLSEAEVRKIFDYIISS